MLSGSFVCPLVFVSLTFYSAVPTFSHSLASTVPKITVSGLRNSSTPDTSSATSGLLALSGSHSRSLSIDSWNRLSGVLILSVNTTIPLTASSTTFWFNFKLLNPSSFQSAPGIDLVVKYTAVWSNEATGNGASYVQGIAAQTDPSYPMSIANTLISSWIAQSSPYPCDNNTLTVTLRATTHIYPLCSPLLTLSGLTGTSANITTLKVSFISSGLSIADKEASWNRQTGTLNVSLFGSEPNEASIPASTDLIFAFVLRNPAVSQQSPTTSLQVSFRDKPPTGNALYTSSFHARTTHSSSAMTVPNGDVANLQISSKDQCEGRPASGDANPLSIREISFTSLIIAQSSFSPCELNSITLTLRTDGPLFQSCLPRLTLTGLSGSATSSTALALAVVAAGPFSSSGSWEQSGTLSIPLMAGGLERVLRGCVAYSITFLLKNPVQPQSASPVTLSGLPTISTAIASTLTASNSDPIKVLDLVWAQKVVTSTSRNPCELNTITIVLESNINILQSCVESLQFTGLAGSMTDNTQNLKLTMIGNLNPFKTDAMWDRTQGVLTVNLTNNSTMTRGVPYSFSFQIRNGRVAQSARSVSVFAPKISSTNQATMFGDILEILAPGWVVNVASSSQNPCAETTISITITPQVAPIQIFCDPRLTIQGLTGSSNSATEITAFSTAPGNNGFNPVAQWSRSTGKIELNLNGTLAVGTEYSYVFKLQNRPTEQAAQDVKFMYPSTFLTSVSNFTTVGGLMQIKRLVMTASAKQSNHWPCAVNTITVSFQTDIDLLSGCRYGDTFASTYTGSFFFELLCLSPFCLTLLMTFSTYFVTPVKQNRCPYADACRPARHPGWK